MPIYQFRCRKCQREFEAQQTLQEHATSLPPCPSCGAQDTEVLLSPFFAKTSRKA
jgi:putative FmdB family regulatory protein